MKNGGKKKLPTEAYKGVRDFYPDEMFIQNYIMGVMRETAESFGYVEYSSSILEPAELYEAKSGEEIVKEQTYTFTDRGDRRVTLRPEMTPSVARLVAARKRDLSFPLRWYSIPNVFRYERPQRGRLREHWQLNCDIFGVPGLEADVEIILLASSIMRAFGAKDTEFEIRINDRNYLKTKLKSKVETGERLRQTLSLLDKSEKDAEAKKKVQKILGNMVLDGGSKVKEILDMLSKQGVKNTAAAPLLTRGFEYYTGIVFEVFDLAPENNRSIFGGGCYDNLLDIFGVTDVPAVGFGMGEVTMRDFLETHGLLPEYVSSTDLYIGTLAPEYIPAAQALAARLRREGVTVAVHLNEKKIGDQIKTAGRQSIPFFLAVGSDETSTKRYTVKNLDSGKERKVPEEEIASAIWSEGIGENI